MRNRKREREGGEKRKKGRDKETEKDETGMIAATKNGLSQNYRAENNSLAGGGYASSR